MLLTPQSLYQQELDSGSIVADSAQQFAVERLEQLFQLLQQPAGLFGRRKPIQGIYMWGSVGVGKTFLMDLFYSCLPQGNKWRLHYHHFMARIHDELKQESGKADPLQIIGKRLAREFQLLCLDELYITDIGDGMIVYNLFKTLFDEGVVIVITSNFPVEKLYKDELQPQLFEPAIALIKQHTRYLYLDGQQDYRLLQQNPHKTYFLHHEMNFKQLFDDLNKQAPFDKGDLIVCGRSLHSIRYHDRLAWFDFDTLCNGPRSKLDYIELAERFSTILISDIPILGFNAEHNSITGGTEDMAGDHQVKVGRRKAFTLADNAIRRFITLVDELYDRGVNLYLSAQVPLPELYVGEALAFEFQRTRSRLTEMQSEEYLRKQHY